MVYPLGLDFVLKLPNFIIIIINRIVLMVELPSMTKNLGFLCIGANLNRGQKFSGQI